MCKLIGKFLKFEFKFMITFHFRIYLSIPEYGFSSKIASAKKKTKFQPTTPAKKTKSMLNNEINSPISNLLIFDCDN